jgi:hypothetical protein
MKQPFYESIDGRPLVYLFNSSVWKDLLLRLRSRCAKAGVPEPFAVLMANNAEPEDAIELQGLCSYAGSPGHARTWDEFFEQEMSSNELRAQSGLPVIPHFSMGWNPSPRISHPVPWCTYPQGDYAPPATEAQLLAAADRLKAWVEERRDICTTGHVLTFAWNEFEEGGWICPTLGPSPTMPDTRYRDAFAKIAGAWKA